MKILNRSQRRAKNKRDKENPLRKAKLVKKRPVLAVKKCDDGREVCNLKSAEGKREYFRRTEFMVERQGYKCGCGCGQPIFLFSATFDHEDGRGMNGAHRDDRIRKNGKPYNRALRWDCNAHKGSKRGYGN